MTADDLMSLMTSWRFPLLQDDEGAMYAQIKAEVTRLHAEAETLRVQLAHWRVFGEHAEGERSRLQLEVQALRVNAEVRRPQRPR